MESWKVRKVGQKPVICRASTMLKNFKMYKVACINLLNVYIILQLNINKLFLNYIIIRFCQLLILDQVRFKYPKHIFFFKFILSRIVVRSHFIFGKPLGLCRLLQTPSITLDVWITFNYYIVRVVFERSHSNIQFYASMDLFSNFFL